VRELWTAHLAELLKTPKTKPSHDDSEPGAEPPEAHRWKEQLLNQLMNMTPGAFERLARRLLREADFDSVTVTGQSSDGRIGGLGAYRLGLASPPVFFQRKGPQRRSPSMRSIRGHHGIQRRSQADARFCRIDGGGLMPLLGWNAMVMAG
jgi:restriction system protein